MALFHSFYACVVQLSYDTLVLPDAIRSGSGRRAIASGSGGGSKSGAEVVDLTVRALLCRRSLRARLTADPTSRA